MTKAEPLEGGQIYTGITVQSMYQIYTNICMSKDV